MTSRHPLDHRGRAIPDGSWPDGRLAPDGLDAVRRFVNTTNLESGADRLDTPELFDAWLEAEGRRALEVTEDDLARLVNVRERLRDHLTARSINPDDIELGDIELGGEAPSMVPADLFPVFAIRFEADEAGRFTIVATEPDSVDAFLIEIATALVVASATGTLARLKTCTNPHCRWAYYDWSRNTGGRWCSMQACGGRHKARAYRKRRVEANPASTITSG